MTPLTSPRRIILGLMTVGPPGLTGTRITTLEEFNSCLDLFQKSGYSEIDTARLYADTQQEAFTRQAKWQERGLLADTKWFPWQAGAHSPQRLTEALNKSLQELGTESVEVFYLHAPDRSVPFADTFGTLDQLYRNGKFKKLGLSNFSAFEVAEVVTMCYERGWVRPTVYQAVYNAFARTIEAELIPCCQRYGIDVVVFNPLAGGLLSGKYKPCDANASQHPKEGRFSDTFGFQGKVYRDRYFKRSMFSALEMLQPLVRKYGLSMAEVALRWCIHHSALQITRGTRGDGVIVGFSSIDQLTSNLADLEKGPLPDELVAALNRAWAMVKADSSDFWFGDLKYEYIFGSL